MKKYRRSERVGLPDHLAAKRPKYRKSIACPECGCEMSLVVDSRASRASVRRRRVCKEGHRFTTYETAESEPLFILNYEI